MLKINCVDMPASKIFRFLSKKDGNCRAALNVSGRIKAGILPYQAAALYVLAKQYDGGNLLDIGTAAGYSASVMAQAAPAGRIVTLNPARYEIPAAAANLGRFHNIEIVCVKSWDYLERYGGPELGLVFVDGDHKRVRRDVPWWDWLREDGLMLFHDYTPKGSPPVVVAVDRMATALGRPPDVLLVDDGGAGMAGFYKTTG